VNRPVLVSACLLGLATRYDGTSKHKQHVIDWFEKTGNLPVPVCPEQLGGLPTPREQTRFLEGDGAAVLAGTGRVVSRSGCVMNHSFIAGARMSATVADLTGCRLAILKERSPSCGVREIHCGERIVAGLGVTTALLIQAGITVFSEEQLPPTT